MPDKKTVYSTDDNPNGGERPYNHPSLALSCPLSPPFRAPQAWVTQGAGDRRAL
jgi:hypothetical protein